jgi:hypothetical protein
MNSGDVPNNYEASELDHIYGNVKGLEADLGLPLTKSILLLHTWRMSEISAHGNSYEVRNRAIGEEGAICNTSYTTL